MFKRMQLKMAMAFMLLLTTVLLAFGAGIYLLLETSNNRQLANEIQTMLQGIQEAEWLTEGYEETPDTEGIDEGDSPEKLETPKPSATSGGNDDDDDMDDDDNTDRTEQTEDDDRDNEEQLGDDDRDETRDDEEQEDDTDEDEEDDADEAFVIHQKIQAVYRIGAFLSQVTTANAVTGVSSTEQEAVLENIELKIPRTLSIFDCYFVYDNDGNLVHWKNNQAALFNPISQAARNLPEADSPRVMLISEEEQVSYLMAKVPIIIQDAKVGTVSVGRDISVAQSTIANLTRVLWMSLLVGAFLSGILGYLIAGRTIKPIRQAYLSKERFVADASHELRTPLSVIMLSADALESIQDDDGFRQQTIQDIKEETKKMSGLVENLLFLARSDSNRLQMRQEPLSLTDLLHKELKGFGMIAQMKHIRLLHDIPEAISLRGDAKLIGSVVNILTDNAIKYTPDEGTVRVSCYREGKGRNAVVVLTVEDSGIGIPQTELKRIFDRFHRIESSRSRTSGGYGLGLSIAKEIVELHGGTIEVTSTENVGTRFVVRLPI